MYINDILRALPRFLSAAWLFFSSLATISIVALSLSAFQVQTRIQSFSSDGENFSVWHLERLRARKAARLEELANHEAILAKLRAREQKAKEEMLSFIEIDVREASIQDHVALSLTALIVSKKPAYVVPNIERWSQVSVLQNEAEKLGFQSEVAALRATFRESQVRDIAATSEVQRLEDLHSRLATDIKARTAEADALRTKLDPLFDANTKLGPEAMSRVLDFASELDVLEKDIRYLSWLTKIPNELLTIALVSCMGMLGSTIYLTQLLFAEPARASVSFFIFRQLLGALAALAMFVILKAGVIVAVEPRSFAQSGADLNPFLVAFLAIISGLLSEQAIDRIKMYGQDLLASSRLGRQRYASGVREELQSQNKSVDDLARFFGDRKDLVERWLSEEETVPPAAQTVIAAWLNRDERQLFSDVPLRKSSAAQTK